jgi:hypothetical protein
VLRNVGIYNSDAGELPRRKQATEMLKDGELREEEKLYLIKLNFYELHDLHSLSNFV